MNGDSGFSVLFFRVIRVFRSSALLFNPRDPGIDKLNKTELPRKNSKNTKKDLAFAILAFFCGQTCGVASLRPPSLRIRLPCIPCVPWFCSSLQSAPLEIQHSHQILKTLVVMLRYALEYRPKCAHFQRLVIRDGLVMLAVTVCRDPNVRTDLPSHRIVPRSQGSDKVHAGNVSGHLHGASTSSLTKCNLTIPGLSPGSS